MVRTWVMGGQAIELSNLLVYLCGCHLLDVSQVTLL